MLCCSCWWRLVCGRRRVQRCFQRGHVMHGEAGKVDEVTGVCLQSFVSQRGAAEIPRSQRLIGENAPGAFAASAFSPSHLLSRRAGGGSVNPSCFPWTFLRGQQRWAAAGPRFPLLRHDSSDAANVSITLRYITGISQVFAQHLQFFIQ